MSDWTCKKCGYGARCPNCSNSELSPATGAVYGYCPRCGLPGSSRERRPNGNDRCPYGHVYPSRDAQSEFNDSMEATIKRLNAAAISLELNGTWKPESNKPKTYLSVLVWGLLAGEQNQDCHEGFWNGKTWLSVRPHEHRDSQTLPITQVTHWMLRPTDPNKIVQSKDAKKPPEGPVPTVALKDIAGSFNQLHTKLVTGVGLPPRPFWLRISNTSYKIEEDDRENVARGMLLALDVRGYFNH